MAMVFNFRLFVIGILQLVTLNTPEVSALHLLYKPSLSNNYDFNATQFWMTMSQKPSLQNALVS